MRVSGAASVATVWRRYAQTSAWSTWAPQIRSVEAEAELREGMRGYVVPVLGPRVAFVVEAVDNRSHSWRWRVRVGPVRIRLWHTVRACTRTGTEAELHIEGAALIVMAYAPLARCALLRLVAD